MGDVHDQIVSEEKSLIGKQRPPASTPPVPIIIISSCIFCADPCKYLIKSEVRAQELLTVIVGCKGVEGKLESVSSSNRMVMIRRGLLLCVQEMRRIEQQRGPIEMGDYHHPIHLRLGPRGHIIIKWNIKLAKANARLPEC